MNLCELLAGNPAFEGAALLTGSAGADGEITSVMVLEAIDIEGWGKRGQLLLSSFFAFNALSEDEVRSFFKSCGKIGIGGIALKPGRLVADIPAFFIACCEENNVPLILLPSDAKYENIILSVLEPIMAQIVKERRSAQRRSELVAEILSHRAEDELEHDKRLAELGIKGHNLYKICLIKSVDGAEYHGTEQILDRLLRSFNDRNRTFILHRMTDATVVIFNYAAAPAPGPELLRDVLARLCRALHIPADSFYAVLSLECGRLGLAAAYTETTDAVRLLGGAHLLEDVTDCASLGIYRLFLSNRNRQMIDLLIDERHAALHRDSPDLWKTLSTYVEERGSCTATSERLFMHPKTVKYRIEKVRTKYNIDGDDAHQSFSILLDDKLFRIAESGNG